MDINLNSAECIKNVTHLGYESYHNICSGAITTIPWGFFDWFGMVILFGFLALGISALIWAVKHG